MHTRKAKQKKLKKKREKQKKPKETGNVAVVNSICRKLKGIR